MTAYGDLATAVEAVRQGSFEYLLKPFDLDVAQRALERAFDAIRLRPMLRSAAKSSAEDDNLVGKSAVMQEVFRQIALVASSDACVHVFGESGSGKELVARAIHRYSRRHAGPFVAVNLASLSESLSESELFGHTRGAFTGGQNRRGLLEQAHGGTIFLDEVADIPLSLQVKLLRVLEHGELWPVGARAGAGGFSRDFGYPSGSVRASGGRPLPPRSVLPTEHLSGPHPQPARAPRRRGGARESVPGPDGRTIRNQPRRHFAGGNGRAA